MNLGKNPTTEEFLAEIKRTQAELVRLREEAWKKAEVNINMMLNDADCPFNDDVKTVYRKLMHAIWTLGYNSGANDMSIYMARELGAGAMVDYMALYEKMLKSKPENN